VCKKLLLLAFRFPPYSRVGAYRWSMLGPRIARLGHEVHVLTVQWPNMGYTDWLDEVRTPGLTIHRIRSGYPHRLKYTPLPKPLALGRSAFLRARDKLLRTMDEAHYWGRYLLPAAHRLLDEHDIDTIIATGAPFSTNYWAAHLRTQRRGLRLVQDFRDPWYSNRAQMLRDPHRHRFEVATREADVLVGVTPEMASLFGDLAGHTDVRCVPNGVDLSKLRSVRASESMSYDFVYMGALFNKRDVPMARFLQWARKRRDEGRPVTVKVIGRYPDSLRFKFADLLRSGHLSLSAPLSQRDAWAVVAASRCALHFNGPIGIAETQVTTKLVEHGALKRPTLSLNYGGVVGPFIEKHGLGWSFHADAPDLDRSLDGCIDAPPPSFRFDVDEFDYEHLAHAYSAIIES
jgi:uncharacterized glyoxalase superfamily protein PhnB